MPATDWREITFSRAHLRPGDGLDPEVRPLRRKAVALAKEKQIPAYLKAARLLEAAEKKEQTNRDKIREDEVVRQSKERKDLAEALVMRVEHFDEEWAHNRKLMEEQVAEKRKGFEDKCEGQKLALELQIETKAQKNMKLYKGSRIPPVIYSSIVRDDRQIEGRQAQAGVCKYTCESRQRLVQGNMLVYTQILPCVNLDLCTPHTPHSHQAIF